MFKKAVVFLLTGIMIFSLAACGSESGSGDRDTGSGSSVKEEQQSETVSDGKESDDSAAGLAGIVMPDEKDSEGANVGEESVKGAEVSAGEEDGEGKTEGFQIVVPENFAEVILCDTEQYTVRVEKIEYDKDYYVYFKLSNKSGEQLRFEMYSPSVNDLMFNNAKVDLTFYENVSAGEEVSAKARFKEKDLKALGIGRITEIGCNLRVIDSKWNAICDESYIFYPFGEADVEEYVQEIDESDILLVSGENYSVYVTGMGLNDVKEYIVDLYIENNSDGVLGVSTSPNALNNTMFDNYVHADVSPGRKAVAQLCIDKDILKEAGLADFGDIAKISTWMTCDLDGTSVFEQAVSVYPGGDENIDVKQPDIRGDVILDNEVCTIYHTTSGFEKNNYCLGICIVNKTDNMLYFNFGDTALNGVSYGSLYSGVRVMGQSRCNTKLKWDMDKQKSLGVEYMETFTINVNVSDEQTYQVVYDGTMEGKEFEK